MEHFVKLAYLMNFELAPWLSQVLTSIFKE